MHDAHDGTPGLLSIVLDDLKYLRGLDLDVVPGLTAVGAKDLEHVEYLRVVSASPVTHNFPKLEDAVKINFSGNVSRCVYVLWFSDRFKANS